MLPDDEVFDQDDDNDDINAEKSRSHHHKNGHEQQKKKERRRRTAFTQVSFSTFQRTIQRKLSVVKESTVHCHSSQLLLHISLTQYL